MATMLIIFTSLFLAWIKVEPSTCKSCGFNEVVFVLDVSQTIDQKAYRQLKNFTTHIIFKIHHQSGDATSSRVGVVMFADSARKMIYCDQYISSGDDRALKEAVLALKRGNEIFTNIRDGILKGTELLYERGCGARTASHQKLLVLISDGRANLGIGGKEGIYQAARQTRDRGIVVLAIGIGNKIAMDMLQRIVGNEKYFVTGATLDDVFDSTIAMVGRETCSITLSTTTSTIPSTTSITQTTASTTSTILSTTQSTASTIPTTVSTTQTSSSTTPTIVSSNQTTILTIPTTNLTTQTSSSTTSTTASTTQTKTSTIPTTASTTQTRSTTTPQTTPTQTICKCKMINLEKKKKITTNEKFDESFIAGNFEENTKVVRSFNFHEKQFEIFQERTFNISYTYHEGRCFIKKVQKATEQVESLLTTITAILSTIEKCAIKHRQRVKETIAITANADFTDYDLCVQAKCEMTSLLEKLITRKTWLKRQLVCSSQDCNSVS